MSPDISESDMKKAEAFFRGTEALCTFADQRIIPVMLGTLSRTKYEDALFETYYRMQYWLLSLVKLDHLVVVNCCGTSRSSPTRQD
jgi:hypothetical protein